ncbi:hypothetical protein [Mycobacterium malmoense]|uniref:hypothetical protein n=1 Tax=Mycobacterium malmoense TaxID=1780 RepID=UPI001E2BC339|nr:hypothetical protein [Mycobacterium malmoense]
MLTRAGVPAVLVARGRHAEVLAAAGMTLNRNRGRATARDDRPQRRCRRRESAAVFPSGIRCLRLAARGAPRTG